MGRLPELAPDEPERAGSAMAESISCIAFSKGSRYLATAGSGSTVKVWDLKRKVMVKSLSGHTERVNAVTYSGGDSHIASAGTSGQILLHAQLSGTCVGEIIAEPASGVNALQYSTHALSRHLLAAASDNGSVHVWDSTVRSLRAQFLDVHTARATSLAFSPSAATTLVSGGLDKRVQWLDVATCSAVHTLLVEAPVTSVAIKGDGVTLACGISSGKILVYDLRQVGSSTARPLSVLRGQAAKPVTALHWQAHSSIQPLSLVPPTVEQSHERGTPMRNTAADGPRTPPGSTAHMPSVDEMKEELRRKLEERKMETFAFRHHGSACLSPL
ncbi:hypothetical protein CYMTET_13935 [Cymbomonas tetramitiformis]|uniref:Uncharacterized protein n=1 Tax=Cymbomonas tetramitiformis TaxID=36881 RepID=A0AAE0GH09_9CHLO|nr:hypothetical protein CYMTET_13935 [Cymbomonas tetramitiformis]